MRKAITISICIFLMLSLALGVCAVSSVPKTVVDATESVVRIYAEYLDGTSSGSGFVIKSDGNETLIATNYRVVEGNPYSISVWISKNESVDASILVYTNQKDLCILKLTHPVQMDALILSETEIKQGDAIFAVGFPGAADILTDEAAHSSSEATITNGIVSAVRSVTISEYGTPTSILQINAAINAGNSGGPLFNTKGEVVGINTYGIGESQGIFGAIEITELVSFAADNSIFLDTKIDYLPLIIAGIAILVVFVLIIVLLVTKKKDSNRNMRKKKRSSLITLGAYMQMYPEGMGLNDAVAMLLPVALQLRDMHNNGVAHLQVSPSTVLVGETGAVLSKATDNEAGRYISGFAAPEIYRGVSAGNLSDIYSFCAILSYVASGIIPPNALSCADEDCKLFDCDRFEGVFLELLNKGMEGDISKRIDSMQEVIIKLSRYNIHPFTRINATTVESTKIKVKKKRYLGVKLAITFAVLFVIVGGAYFWSYTGVKENVRNDNLVVAEQYLVLPGITKLHDPDLVSYVDAWRLMVEHKFTEAKEAFVDLSGYMNAETYVYECDYRQALQFADMDKFQEAIDLMSQLMDAGYKDADIKVLDIQYRQGVYLLTVEKNYPIASRLFNSLANQKYDGAAEMYKETWYQWGLYLIDKEDYINAYHRLIEARGHADCDEILESLQELLYLMGEKLYYEEEYSEAEKYFYCTRGYANTDEYLRLINSEQAKWWEKMLG